MLEVKVTSTTIFCILFFVPHTCEGRKLKLSFDNEPLAASAPTKSHEMINILNKSGLGVRQLMKFYLAALVVQE